MFSIRAALLFWLAFARLFVSFLYYVIEKTSSEYKAHFCGLGEGGRGSGGGDLSRLVSNCRFVLRKYVYATVAENLCEWAGQSIYRQRLRYRSMFGEGLARLYVLP